MPSNEILRSDNDANHSGCQCCDHNGAGGNRKSRSKKSIDNFDTWLSAWNNYEVVIIDHKPEYYSNLAAHRQMIQKSSHKYYWQAVYTYDLCIRVKHGAMKSFRFNEIDTDLFVTVLDSTAVKQNAVRCLRCKGYDHLVQDCPFQMEYQVEKAQKYAKGKEAPGKRVSSQEKWFHNKQEGCNNWQYERCQFGTSCKRAHVCKGCKGQNLTPNAPHVISAKSPLNLAAIETSLSDHPDKEYVSKILTYIKQGVPIGYEGPRETRVSKNWPSAKLYAAAVEASLAKDVSKGRKAGPFMFPPFSTFVGSPMGAFPKKRSVNKYRVIHDLSWPPGHSVNDFITEDCSLEYINMDTIAKLVKQCGTGSLLAKLDLEDAYKHILVRPQDWDLLGSTWLETDKNGVGHIVYYVDTVLPFGLRSAPKII